MSLHKEDYRALMDSGIEFVEAHPKAIVLTLVILFAFFAGYALG